MQALFRRLQPARQQRGLPPPKGGFRYHENSRLSPRSNASRGRKVHLPAELRARAAPVVGTSFLSVIIRRGYTRAFPRLVRIGFANY